MLLEASDGHFYVVKFLNNPQHPRILVNELIAHAIVSHLQIATPPCVVLEVPESLLRGSPGAAIQLGNRLVVPQSGLAFGSRYPGNPDANAIYNFVPDSLIDRVQNSRDFLAALVFDRWVGNGDGRQTIFFRPPLGGGRRKKDFVALMIDNGFIFNGPEWTFVDSPILGLYPRRTVYRSVQSLDDFEPWLERVSNFPEALLHEAACRIPGAWIRGDEHKLDRLLRALLRRRRRIHELVEQSYEAFSNWKAVGQRSEEIDDIQIVAVPDIRNGEVKFA